MVEALGVSAAVVVDSRNVFHQCGDATGVRACPSVAGIRIGLARYGFDVAAVHVGLALARTRDKVDLAKQHALNEAYRNRVIAEGGDPLLGELHLKPTGTIEEKMVDGACCVRITRYVEEIASARTTIEAIIVLSKDIDLAPAVDYAVASKVPITVAALNVVQHRGHPYMLLAPSTYAEMAGDPTLTTGHEYRELLACALRDGNLLPWKVGGSRSHPRLVHGTGIVAVPEKGTPLPSYGQTVSLRPVDVMWDEKILGSFPILVCGKAHRASKSWQTAVVRKRTAPMTVEIELSDGTSRREQSMLGGVIPGDSVLVHRTTGRILGRLINGNARLFDPDLVDSLRVASVLPKGGAVIVSSDGNRGLLTTDQKLRAGQRLPGMQIDLNKRGPVWVAVGTPLP
ncbi:hypothetical protein [Amycolatopsis sp. NPDC051061]|uniref:hypothetical protein n=1 Tax=Amycolatopsis sp. NPDC051061 TaxID=3155042 RepID=UPI00341D881D